MTADPLGVEEVSSARVPTIHGEFQAHVFRAHDGTEHLALVCGQVSTREVLVRVHSECLTGDVLASLRCDCGDQLGHALASIGAEGSGIVIYLRGHEGRGIGIGHKIAAYALQDAGLDTVDANLQLGLPIDDRKYDTAAHILIALGVSGVRLMTNNPAKVTGLRDLGLAVKRVSIVSTPNVENLSYLRAKQLRMGHVIDGLDDGTIAENGQIERDEPAPEKPRERPADVALLASGTSRNGDGRGDA